MSQETNVTQPLSRLALLVPPYVVVYTLLGLWLMIDGWLTGFSALKWMWSQEGEFSPLIKFMLFTMNGALLGCAVLGIISFHRYYSLEKSFDRSHIWGYMFAPLLAIVVGALAFALLQSGLFVLSGNVAKGSDPQSASLAYFAIGSIVGYNWDVFAEKLEALSSNIKEAKVVESKSEGEEPKPKEEKS